MDVHANLEYLCRVCAANTKGKNSVAECVYILKTAGLKDKLDKFLYLKVFKNDSLPKVLCKSCFRQVEATASLSKIAKHTQEVFRDFLLSNLPKGPSESSNTNEFTSCDFMGNRDANEKSKEQEIMPAPALPPPPLVAAPAPAPASTPVPVTTPLLPPPSQQLQPITSINNRKDEVIVNVSVADPLTRDNQQKMISNSQRRQSLLLESRFTPKTIAQKPSLLIGQQFRSITAKPNQPLETSVNTTTTNSNTSAKLPISSVNFYPVKTQTLPQATQITTFSSGGYVIGRIDNEKEETKKITMPLALTADNILQQKRKNLVKALNNIKANSSGQVSLLKSSQQKKAEALQNVGKTPLTEAVTQAAEDELPEKIIIANPKNKSSAEKSKKEPLNLSSKVPATITPLPAAASSGIHPDAVNNLNNTPPKPAFPEDILLGRVIRDMDLLKLILKALKWPVNKQNMELQLQILKNSKFTDIISDSNLLQDTDLTQLLSPYLAPVLLAAQALQQQQQQIVKNTIAKQNVTVTPPAQAKMTALEVAQAEINKSIPYKLPPETSVQLVPALPEDNEVPQSVLLSTANTITTSTSTTTAINALGTDNKQEMKMSGANQKRQRRAAAQRARDSIIISDEEDAFTEGKRYKRSKKSATPNIHIDLNPNFLSQFNLLNGSAGNSGAANEAEELMNLLMKQKAAVLKDKKIQRRRRNSVSNLITLPPSEFDALIDLDEDFVLVEPVSTTTTTSTSEASSSSNSEPPQQPPKTDITNTFLIPSVPLITRPIIKRRKTVIHPPKNRFDLSVELKSTDLTPISSFATSSFAQSKEKRLEDIINQVATGGDVTNVENVTKKQNSNTTIVSSAAVANAAVTTVTPVSAAVTPAEMTLTKSNQQKKMQNKSTLGQQLLEAIGLQKATPNKVTSNTTPAETPSASAAPSTMSNAITVLPNSKQSIQQIRTALKKSLKQAQEQQQQKKKELSSSTSSSNNNTIIQDADSTTKPAVTEIVVVEDKANHNDNGSSMVDVEEQIDKVTLIMRKSDEENGEQSTNPKAINKSEVKKEMKKLSGIKAQERRRTLLATMQSDKENPSEEQQQQQEQIIETTDNNEKLQILESADVKSNGVTEAVDTSVKPDIVVPKKRGRKRLIDKQNELLAAEAASAKERDNKELSLEEESDTGSHNLKNEEDVESNKSSGGRPVRQSKTQSRYYKGPDKPAQGKRFLPSRTTRNRKYC